MQIVVLSGLMFRRAVFGRGVAFLGVFSGIFGIVAGFLAGESDFLFYLGLLPFVSVAFWFRQRDTGCTLCTRLPSLR